ncbi:MAG TPA: efflux transporter outer membrane subunit [Planctomycetota bacterium]|nr:efflux transporter outer membrane subunit [Planctomycetota bacterium]
MMTAMRRGAGAMAALGLLAGCLVGPDYERPATSMPAKWTGLDGTPVKSSPQAGAPEVESWWIQFRDPILTGLIQRANSANLSLAQAQAVVRQARAARVIAASGLYPSVDLGASGTRSRTASPVSGPSTGNFFQAGFDAAWEIDVFGGLRRGVEAAQAQIESAYFNREATRTLIDAEVATTYFVLRGAQRQLEVARKNLEAQEQTLKVIQDKFNAGFVALLDLANAKVQVGQTASQIPAYDALLRTSIYAISVLLGQEPSALLEELLPVQGFPVLPGQIPVGLPSDLLRRRPDLRKAEADLHAATANVGVAVAGQYPTFSLTGSIGQQSSTLSTLLKRASNVWSFGPAATLPLFAGGKLEATVEQAEAITEQALIGYRAAVLTALQDVETALVNFTREQERRESLAEASVAGQQAVTSALDLYGAGRTDFLNVLTAQAQLYATQSSLAQSEANIGMDLVALYKALGGGWIVTEGSEGGHSP